MVFFHGGGVNKDSSGYPALFEAIAARGAVVVTPNWGPRTGNPAADIDTAVYDNDACIGGVACAVSFTVTHAGEWGAAGGSVTLAGHSGGANAVGRSARLCGVLRVLVVGPTSASWNEVAEEVEADLARLRRSGIEVSYRCTGAGPKTIRCEVDVIEAAPHVVRAVVAAAGDGFDGVIVDCTDDPGVDAARQVVEIPVIGAGEALRSAITRSPRPVRLFTGDEMRTMASSDLVERARGASTVALGATGYSRLVEAFTAVRGVQHVIDPLDAALECLLATMK